jgi:UDPglucose 6-dehydrogenase
MNYKNLLLSGLDMLVGRHGHNSTKCPHIQVTVVDLNEERIAAWNDEDVDNIPFTNRVCQKSLRKLEGKLIFHQCGRAIDEAQIISYQ